jgi:hypothetical protein
MRGSSARTGRADEHLLLAPLRVGEAEPDAIAHGACIERTRARGVEHRVRVAHVDHEVQHALEHAGEHAETMLRILLVPGPGGRIARPVLGVTVDQRRRGERHGPQVVEAGLEQRIDRGCVRARRGAIQEIDPSFERGGERLGDRLEGRLLALA